MITELIEFLRDTSASFKERLNLPTNSHSRAKLIFSGGLTFLVFFFSLLPGSAVLFTHSFFPLHADGSNLFLWAFLLNFCLFSWR